MTDVGLRIVPTFDYQHAGVAVRRDARRAWTRSMLPWDLVSATAAAAVTTVTWPIAPLPVLTLLVGCWVACLAVARAAEVPLVGPRAQGLARVIRAGGMFALTGSALSIVPGISFTTTNAFAAALAATAISSAVRLVVLTRPARPGSVLVVGEAAERELVVDALGRGQGPARQVVSVCLQSETRPGPPGEITVPLQDLPAYASEIGAEAVVVVPGPQLDPVGLRRLQWVLEGARLPCFVGTGLVGVAPTRLATVDLGGQPLVRVHAASRSGPAGLLVELAGRVLAAVALLLLLPVLMVLAVAIRRGSPGPAVYRQSRVGRDGRIFTVFKLRTMTAEPMDDTPLENDCDGVLFKMRRDPRITPLGGWLRKYSVDELPQLANVALGQMRLVGPRPALPEEVAEYSEDAHRRLAVKPGITGLWQVSGRSDLTWEETVRLDLHYVDNWSLWLDLLILGRTVSAVLGHRGAY